jgi:hypothetical protein
MQKHLHCSKDNDEEELQEQAKPSLVAVPTTRISSNCYTKTPEKSSSSILLQVSDLWQEKRAGAVGKLDGSPDSWTR